MNKTTDLLNKHESLASTSCDQTVDESAARSGNLTPLCSGEGSATGAQTAQVRISSNTRTGRLRFYETTLQIWEEPKCDTFGPYAQDFMDRVFKPIIGFLRKRGWTVEPDPNGKHYKSIAKYMWIANHGDLRLKLHQSGRTIEMNSYQEVVTEHPNGGQYDSKPFTKMPYLIRKRFTCEARALIERLTARHGYPVDRLAGRDGDPLASRIEQTARHGSAIPPTEDPLASFNDCWDSEWDKKRGTHRFERDETGWPARSQMNGYGWNGGGCDRHGVYIEPGSVRYWIDYNGYVMRGRAYPNMNSMCVFVYGPDQWTQCDSTSLFVPQPGQSLRKVKGYGAGPVLKRLIAEAVKAENFERAAILRDARNKFAAKAEGRP